jgi:hypothetical protein
MPARLLPLLYCPLCPSKSPLVSPITLFCGHTLCAKHVSIPDSHSNPLPTQRLRLTPCPLKGCNASPFNPLSPPNIPSSSRITFYPPVGPHLDPDSTALETIPDSQTDVTINKLATIIHQYAEHHTERPPTLYSGSDSDSQTDEEIMDTHPSPAKSSESSISPQISSDRKRRRKQFPPPRRLDAPTLSADLFEKELFNELSCEICLMLLYQPITSPCQHVRSLSHPSSLSINSLSDLLYKVSLPFLRPRQPMPALSIQLAWILLLPGSPIQQNDLLYQSVSSLSFSHRSTAHSVSLSSRGLSRGLRGTWARD